MKSKLNVLFIGDIVGEPGLKAVKTYLPEIRQKYEVDFIIANGENITNGKGLTEKEADILFEQDVRIITTGNHIWDNWKSRPLLAANPNILRPLNYPSGNPGKGYAIVNYDEDISVCVLQLQGRTFMQAIDCPFKAAEYALKSINEKTKIVIVDFHADATAEKVTMGWFLDGKVSAVLGTHTHIPTADASILPNGTAFISDVGMTGPFDSVVGMRKDIALRRFTLQTPHKYEMAEGDERVCAVLLTIDVATGQSETIKPIVMPGFVSSIYDQL